MATDISDAFGSIKLPVLADILRDHDTPENKSVLSDLRKKLLLNIVKVDLGGKALHFLVSRGVLQGGRLSSILSDIYYGHMTQHCLHTFTIPPEHTKELFLRGADDFLFMSTNQTRAVEFLKLISQVILCLAFKKKFWTLINTQTFLELDFLIIFIGFPTLWLCFQARKDANQSQCQI